MKDTIIAEAKIVRDAPPRYTPDPGTVDEAYCGVCGDKCEVCRNVNGPRGFVMAMARSTQLHDVFTCPNLEQVWHRQVIALRGIIRKTPSRFIMEQCESEVREVLASRQPTKERWDQ